MAKRKITLHFMKGKDFDITEARVILDWVKKNLSEKRCSICGLVKEELVLCNVKPRYNTQTWTRDLGNWYYACEPCARKLGYIND